jgi:hypothetical protein
VPIDAPTGKKKGTKKLPEMTDKQAAMWASVQEAMAAHGGPIEPFEGMPPVTGITRKTMQSVLIARGWFSDDEVLPDGKIKRPGPTKENNALTALERRGKLKFSRDHVWLP